MEERRLTPEFLKKLLRSDIKFYYTTPYLNDHLYLHYKGFSQMENLEEFTGLKVIYLEGNGFSKIEGLEKCTQIRSLYLQENLIKKIENLENLTQLYNLNLTDNCIETIENLSKNATLQTLLLKRNSIGKNGLSDLKGLTEIPTLTTLDISDNKINDENIIDEILTKLPNLGVLYLMGNEVCKKIKNYRKTIIHKIPSLKYLDDRPVFEDERRYVAAFFRGGLEAEREERKLYKKEQEDKHWENHRKFREMIENYKKEAEETKQQEQQQEQSNDNTEAVDNNDQENNNNSNDLDQPPELEEHKHDSSFSSSNKHGSNSEKLETYNTTTEHEQSSQQNTSQNSSMTLHRQGSNLSLQSDHKTQNILQQEESKQEEEEELPSNDLDDLD